MRWEARPAVERGIAHYRCVLPLNSPKRVLLTLTAFSAILFTDVLVSDVLFAVALFGLSLKVSPLLTASCPKYASLRCRGGYHTEGYQGEACSMKKDALHFGARVLE